MKLIGIAVRDLATESFARPFFVQHPAQAIRSFSDECNNPESEFAKHAKDYELWDLGSFDDESGMFSGNSPVRLVRAVDLVRA